METFYKYVGIFICNVQFVQDDEVCIALVTQNKKYCDSNKKEVFYDFLRKKNITLTEENFINFNVMFTSNISFYKIFNNEYKEDDLKSHYDNNINFAEEFISSNKKLIKEKISLWQTLDVNELYEKCIEELFFAPISTVKSDMIKEMKKRIEFLSLTNDHGVISKLLAIFEIPEDKFLSKDESVVKQCKERWKGVIKFYVNKANRLLDKELSLNYNEDLQIEVTEIKKLLHEVSNEIDTKVFETPKDVASFWPDLLKPSPRYVFEK